MTFKVVLLIPNPDPSPMFHRPNTTICREGWYYLLITAIVFAGAMAKEVNLLLVLGRHDVGADALSLAGALCLA